MLKHRDGLNGCTFCIEGAVNLTPAARMSFLVIKTIEGVLCFLLLPITAYVLLMELEIYLCMFFFLYSVLLNEQMLPRPFCTIFLHGSDDILNNFTGKVL